VNFLLFCVMFLLNCGVAARRWWLVRPDFINREAGFVSCKGAVEEIVPPEDLLALSSAYNFLCRK
jgi:hypothetical protein